MEPRRPTLEVFERALDRESHHLLRRPDWIWQQLQNRLQWEEELVAGTLEPELRRRSAQGVRPWVRTRTRLRESKALIRVLAGHTKRVGACAIAPDSSYVVTASDDNTCRIWDPETGAERAVLVGHTNEVHDCAISPDGSYMVTASGAWDETCRIWDAATGAERATLPLSASVRSVALHRRRPFAVCGDDGGQVHMIEFVGIDYGAIVVTAVDLGQGHAIRCPGCLGHLPLEEGWLGREIECPRRGCEARMRVNPFVVERPRERGRFWRRA